MVLSMKATGIGTNIVAREVALDIAQGIYRPSAAEHVRGASNIIADMLSRKSQPDAEYHLPAHLGQGSCQRSVLEIRGRQVFRTL